MKTYFTTKNLDFARDFSVVSILMIRLNLSKQPKEITFVIFHGKI